MRTSPVNTPMVIAPVTLHGTLTRLEPLDRQHTAELLQAADHDAIWAYLDEPTPRTPADITALIDDAHQDQTRDTRLPFAIIDARTGRAIGSTSYIDIRPHDRGLEIGWTWLTPETWGSGINIEAKYLLLRHAFRELGAIRVALKTDLRNVRSQRAILTLGATTEGVWRNHRILSDGHRRSTVYYSITDTDWTVVEPQLRSRITPAHHSPMP